jgi:hypothetical protein
MDKQTPAEYEESEVRKFLTVLFFRRGKRLLKTLADTYSWSPEVLQEHESRFLIASYFVPKFQEK